MKKNTTYNLVPLCSAGIVFAVSITLLYVTKKYHTPQHLCCDHSENERDDMRTLNVPLDEKKPHKIPKLICIGRDKKE